MRSRILFLLLGLVQSLSSKQPVIIDTDVGSFLDDTFAIVYAALSQELDVKLIVTCTDDTTVRAQVTAKLLRLMGRDDIPIGIGLKNDNKTQHFLFDWAKYEDLSTYRGGVFVNGVGKMAEVLLNSKEMVNIIAIGPMTNFPSLVQECPKCVEKGRIQAMAGSINVGYRSERVPVAEYNVKVCPWCMEVLLKAGWNVSLTPLDTCGNFVVNASDLMKVMEVGNEASLALASSLVYFCIVNRFPGDMCQLNRSTPVLFDVIATLLALPDVAKEFLVFSDMKLSVNGTGFTVVDPTHGVSTSVALYWKDNGEKEFGQAFGKLLSQLNPLCRGTCELF